LKIVTAYYPTPAVSGGRIVYIEPVFKLNDYNIPIEAFVKIADFYKTSIDYIVGKTANSAPISKK
jgi:hypothetical protein